MIFCVVVVVVAVSVVDGRYFAAAKIRVFCGAFRACFTTESAEGGVNGVEVVSGLREAQHASPTCAGQNDCGV
jgi:hypothetical protein